MMQIVHLSLSASLHDRAQYVEQIGQQTGPLTFLATDVARRMREPQSIEEALGTIHEMQRLYCVAALGLQEDERLLTALSDQVNFPVWTGFTPFPATEENRKKLATALYAGDPQQRAPLYMNCADFCRGVAEEVVRLSLADGSAMDVWINDPVFDRRLLSCMTPETAARYGEMLSAPREQAGRGITFNLNDQGLHFADPVPEKSVRHAYEEAVLKRRKEYSADLYTTVTRLPTPSMALIDDIPYPVYADIFCETAFIDDVELDAINTILVEILDNAKEISFYNNDGTALHLNVDGFDTVNSRAGRNVPGGEVFTAPKKYSANGVLVAKGNFIPPKTEYLIRDITLHFENGKIIDADAAEGKEHLLAVVDRDEGSCYLGEVALGTNWFLKHHVSNSLLVEKIGGSFHVAIGRAYADRMENGRAIRLNNGNDSNVHWDIAVMLFGKEGRIIVDGKPIMEDGLYLDPRLHKLNVAA